VKKGKILLYKRKRTGISQRKLSEMMNCREGVVSEMERGIRESQQHRFDKANAILDSLL